jgi:2-polyprenyl-3-methyl-5-hydroxy-6-metoxy-1,4-benzoquinol methylase
MLIEANFTEVVQNKGDSRRFDLHNFPQSFIIRAARAAGFLVHMSERFSKPSGDIQTESAQRYIDDAALIGAKRALATKLLECADRGSCLVCGNSLKGAESFQHRTIRYVRCRVCRHIQSQKLPSNSFLDAIGVEYKQAYPTLSPEQYESRKQRIYRPKLDFVLDSCADLGRTRKDLLDAKWLEIGCGSGYFLSALRDVGVREFRGLDYDAQLVADANKHLGGELVELTKTPVSELVAGVDADVIAAFFVLEHIDDTQRFLANLARQPKGTVFVFSVPTWGLATLLETAFGHHYARILDEVFHVQIFTDASIDFCLRASGFRKVSEWVFGQDALDLVRALVTALRDKLSPALLDEVRTALTALQDPLQHVFDRGRVADSRHVIAVKE